MYDKNKLEELIEEATVDCYDDDEYEQGILCMVEDEVEVPFKAQALGEAVEIKKLTQVGNQLKAICDKSGKEYKVDLLDLEVDYKKVKGGVWLAVYRYWKTGEFLK